MPAGFPDPWPLDETTAGASVRAIDFSTGRTVQGVRRGRRGARHARRRERARTACPERVLVLRLDARRAVPLGFPEPDGNFFPEILDGLTEALRGTEYQVLVGPGGCNDEQAETHVTDAIIDRGMDGMILIAPISSRSRLEHLASRVPTVIVGRHGHSAAYDTVSDDDLTGAALVVGHLAGLGHRRIAHIEHAETDPDRLVEMPNAIRADGYQRAMHAHGLASEIDIVSTTYTQEGGYDGARQLLARSRRPTAIFASADIVAMGVLEAISEAGLSVPDDISVAGYDNTTFARLGPISLTSVDQAGRHIGAETARLLLDRIADRHRPSAQIKLSPTLVPRHTTAPPPK